MNGDPRQYSRPNLIWKIRRPRFRDCWTFLVWLGACFLAYWLYLETPQTDSSWSIRGIIDAGGVSLAPVETARIQKIYVKEGQQVRRGDLLVAMDTSLIAHGVSADLLDAIRIESAFGDTHQDVLQAVSQRLDAIVSLEANIATCKQDWEREKGQLNALKEEQIRREALYADRVIDDLTRLQLLPQIAALEKAGVLYPQRMDMYEKQLVQARKYYRNIMDWLGAVDDQPVSEAIRRRLNEDQVHVLLNQARAEALLVKEAYKIVAPQDGTVSQVLGREGEVIAADIPILRIVGNVPDRIIAYLAETQVGRVHVGEQLLVQSVYRNNPEKVTATVESVSSEVSASSFVISTTGRQVPVRAQRAILRIRDTHPFVGGETVFLRAPQNGLMSILSKIFKMEKRLPGTSGGHSS